MENFDKEIVNKLIILNKEVQTKRDSAPNNSSEKNYYRKISKNLDKCIFEKLKSNSLQK